MMVSNIPCYIFVLVGVIVLVKIVKQLQKFFSVIWRLKFHFEFNVNNVNEFSVLSCYKDTAKY